VIDRAEAARSSAAARAAETFRCRNSMARGFGLATPASDLPFDLLRHAIARPPKNIKYCELPTIFPFSFSGRFTQEKVKTWKSLVMAAGSNQRLQYPKR
jgi:hypothetical protein